MQKKLISQRLSIFALIAMSVIFLANFNNPPNRRTGAPGDSGTCAGCHNGTNPNGFDGALLIENFPTSINPGTTYNLTAKVTNPNGLASRSGFQAVVLNETDGNTNSGDIVVSGSNLNTIVSGGRKYVEHSPGSSFSSNNEITWNFDWIAPISTTGDVINVYAAAVIGNGSGSSGDFVVTTIASGTISSGGDPLTIQITESADVSCFGDNNGTATAVASDGSGTYSYIWSNGETGASAIMLSAGTASVTVTDSDNSQVSTSIQISQPDSPVVADLTSTDETFLGANDGTASVQASGGTGGYTEAWSNGIVGQIMIDNLAPGNYCVTITDFEGCTASNCTMINPSICDLAATTSSIDQTCFESCDGSINVTISGGAQPISYAWSNGSTDQDLSNLCTGEYVLTITDNNNCQIIVSDSISESEAIMTSATIVEETADGTNDGGIDLNVNGGTQPYTFLWDNGETTEDLMDLSAGTYCVTITDSQDCALESCVEVTLFECTPIGISAAGSGNTCTTDCNGTINISVSGGSGNYSFSWDNGETTEDLTDLCNGNYTLVVTDDFDCTASQMVTISSGNFMINEAVISDVTCIGLCNGMITVTTSSGSSPFTYDWSVDDFDGLTEINDLCPGIYDLTVTDGNGCTELLCFDIDETDEIQMNFATTSTCPDAPCNGTVTITTTGGTAPFEYSFDTDGVSFCPGDYDIAVTDANGCTSAGAFTITEAPIIEFTVENIGNDIDGQSNGFFEILVSGGVPGYTFEWRLNGSLVSTDEDPTGLAPGEYDLLITDANGCAISATDLIIDSTSPTSEANTSNELLIFPNPANDIVHILLKNQIHTSPELFIFDSCGKQLNLDLRSTSSSQQWILDVANLPIGVYTLQIKGDGFVWWEKLIKM